MNGEEYQLLDKKVDKINEHLNEISGKLGELKGWKDSTALLWTIMVPVVGSIVVLFVEG